ncbi:MAG: F0F1 ATP synthase subunit B [Lachnospiraceae bacterium]|nr:F0F1 ATP synthase subunit B [Lachnospiraceae bacterium]MBR3683361.1 F0F1 ATP synthase subunit B [Lachnospiraceae bacterium]
MERLFNLDMQLLADSCLTLLAVFALFLLMSYFLFNPARKMLNARQDRIKNDIDSAAADKEEAEKLKAEYEEKLKDINKEAETILAEARKKALANETKIIAEAKEEAARIIARANTEAELEKQKMADDVKKEMVTIAAAMASKVVSASIDATIQSNLIDETLKEIGGSTWLS